MNQDNPWTTLSTKTPYENPWIRVEHSDVLTPAGTAGIYGVVRFKNLAVGVVPIDQEGYTYLVGQFRYALGRYSWEIPEGGCPLGTDALATAKRELQEETGLSANEWTTLLETDLSNSVSDEEGIIFLAQGLVQGQASPEDTEELAVKRVPFAEAYQMVLAGEIRDSLSVMGILRVQLMIQEGKILL
ncbi:MAG: NUDIX hydrolase [Saprospiraceae bacterium]|jgi:8-oxo-dGTP pyrophosphatase MutT (NUDIX family)|nr:NUDIX hydrolase [Saprospiraceae bacterium]